MSALFLELARTVLFLSSSHLHVSIKDDLLNGGKISSCASLMCLGVELLATTLAGKHIATVLAKHMQRLESFVTDITGVNPLSLFCALSPHTDPIQQQHDFPHKPALDTCRSEDEHPSSWAPKS